jgi:hypothetical protein
VLVHASLRASDLVCTAMQVAYLIEEGFELGLVERAHAVQYAGASFCPTRSGKSASATRTPLDSDDGSGPESGRRWAGELDVLRDRRALDHGLDAVNVNRPGRP